ncbi:MAG TPA: cytochrome c oxidase subunit 3, partial [Reyranella sp.]
YWLLTGVHALHLTIGIVVVVVLACQVRRGSRLPLSPTFEGVALYWHLVDIVWIFLYPLIYLPGRAT